MKCAKKCFGWFYWLISIMQAFPKNMCKTFFPVWVYLLQSLSCTSLLNLMVWIFTISSKQENTVGKSRSNNFFPTLWPHFLHPTLQCWLMIIKPQRVNQSLKDWQKKMNWTNNKRGKLEIGRLIYIYIYNNTFANMQCRIIIVLFTS